MVNESSVNWVCIKGVLLCFEDCTLGCAQGSGESVSGESGILECVQYLGTRAGVLNPGPGGPLSCRVLLQP